MAVTPEDENAGRGSGLFSLVLWVFGSLYLHFQIKPAMTMMVTPGDENALRNRAFYSGSLVLRFFGSAFSDIKKGKSFRSFSLSLYLPDMWLQNEFGVSAFFANFADFARIFFIG